MGTSANLWVKHAGKQFVHHTSYDGHPDNVISQVASSVAACGLDALRASISRAVIAPDDGDMEDTRNISFQVGVAKYFEACQARGKAPHGMRHSLRYPYGIPDFAHGGVIALLGAPIIHDEGFCHAEAQADFVLDLDAGELRQPVYEEPSPSPPRWEWSLDLKRIEPCDPEQLMLAFARIDLDRGLDKNQESIEAAIALAEQGLAQQPPYMSMQAMVRDEYAALDAATEADATGAKERAMHQFCAAAQNALALRLIIGLLQRCAPRSPALARPTALMAQMEPDGNGEISLTVDFEDGFANASAGRATHKLVETVGAQAGTLGVPYRFSGQGVSQVFNGTGSIASVISVGSNFEDDMEDEFDQMFGMGKVKLPPGASPVRTMATRHADIREDVAIMDEEAIERLVLEKFVARINLDHETLAIIPDSIKLAPDQVKLSNQWINMMAPLEDAVLPGARHARFLAMDEQSRTELLNSFGGVGRYMFCEELGLSTANSTTPSRPRP